jgi:DNA-binding LytR/AlgR family response regulator
LGINEFERTGRFKQWGKNMKHLMIKLGNIHLFINVGDIDWIESERNYLRVYSEGQSYLLRETLSTLENKLDHEQFIRINHSTIVNVRRLKELRPHSKRDYLVVLDNDKSWILGRRYRKNIQRIIL